VCADECCGGSHCTEFALSDQRISRSALHQLHARSVHAAIAAILSAIRKLMHPPAPKRRGIGFTADLEK
jgi:hypothetical protein